MGSRDDDDFLSSSFDDFFATVTRECARWRVDVNVVVCFRARANRAFDGSCVSMARSAGARRPDAANHHDS